MCKVGDHWISKKLTWVKFQNTIYNVQRSSTSSHMLWVRISNLWCSYSDGKCNGILHWKLAQNYLLSPKTLSQGSEMLSSCWVKIKYQLFQLFHVAKNTITIFVTKHPTAIPVEPKPRRNVPKTYLKSLRETAILGKKNPLKCRFTGLNSNIWLCSEISNFGVYLCDKDMEKYYSQFNCLHGNDEKIEFDDWKLENPVLVNGIIRLAHHMVSHGLFKYRCIGYHNTIVFGVQFLAHGGIALVE